MLHKGAANLEDWLHHFAEGIGSTDLIFRQIHETVGQGITHCSLISPWCRHGKHAARRGKSRQQHE